MFVPEVLLHDWDEFVNELEQSKIQVYNYWFDYGQIKLTIQGFDDHVVWTYKHYGNKEFFEKWLPHIGWLPFREQNTEESYNQYGIAARAYYREYVREHFEEFAEKWIPFAKEGKFLGVIKIGSDQPC